MSSLIRLSFSDFLGGTVATAVIGMVLGYVIATLLGWL